ncbi:MAG: copper homeostasis protein CutC [Planctomycetota bacterium]|nr:copper homeostasis protein CutC [Planctomycetota bacterium]
MPHIFPRHSEIKVEVCVESLKSAILSEKAGADRIELNSAIGLGGLTPSLSSLKQIKSRISLPVVCMVRPRSGNFCYSAEEFEVLLSEATSLLDRGADGLAVGMLDATGAVDEERLSIVKEICGEKELVFHRAFDCTVDLNRAMHAIIQAGANRVLTSGGQLTAVQGTGTLSRLNAEFGDQIEIIAAAGISSGNAADLVLKTNCRQIHGTFSDIIETDCCFDPKLNFNEPLGLQPNQLRESSFEEIFQTIKNLRQLS